MRTIHRRLHSSPSGIRLGLQFLFAGRTVRFLALIEFRMIHDIQLACHFG